MKLTTASCILFFFAVPSLMAQSNEIELDPVTVTTSLAEVKSSKTGRNLIIVSGTQLLQMPVHSVDELLRYLPGIEVQSRGPMGVQSNITLRGGTFQQVLILLDGIRLNDPLTGHFNSYIPIAPNEIDRIEILKGASSAIHGTEAVGGVVHIITKSFTAKKDRIERKITGAVTLGEYGLVNLHAGAFWQKNKTAISGGIMRNTADGQPQRGTNGFFSLNTFSASLKHHFNSYWSIAARSSIDHRDFSAQNFFTTLLSDTATETVSTNWNHVQLSYQKSNHRFSADIGYKQAKDEFRLRKSVPANLNRSQLLQLLLQHEIKFNDKTSVTYGAQSLLRNIRSNDRGNHLVHQSAVFLTLQHQYKNWQLNPAVRLDYHEKAGWELVPQINLSYKSGSIQWRGMAGKTTRDADFTERFNNFQRNPVPTGNRIGNPNLYAETSFSYELGADYFLNNVLKVSGTWFQRFHSGLIDWVRTPFAQMPRTENLMPGGIYFLSKNIGRVNSYGVEIDLQFQQQINDNQYVQFSTGVITLRSKSNDTIPSLYISNHARLLTNFSALYRVKSFSFSANGLYKKRRPQIASSIDAEISRSCTVINLRMEKSIANGKISAFVQADNIFNVRYQDILGSMMPRRWWMSGIKLTL